jgi:N-acetyl-gamma-glutamyl-phosphate reductase
MAKIKTAIIGARGIVGQELFGILNEHPSAGVKYITTGDEKLVGQSYASDNPKFANMTELTYSDEKRVVELARQTDVLFLAGKNEAADIEMVKAIRESGAGCKIVTIGGAYRIGDRQLFEDVYKAEHSDPIGLRQAVYGMPELAGQREKIKNANMIANPGCYATAVTLALAPFCPPRSKFKLSPHVVAISGKTGSGYSLKPEGLFNNANENVRAYALGNTHKHVLEIRYNLDLFDDHQLDFTPMAGPYERGIMAICYMPCNGNYPNLKGLFEYYFKDSPFVNIYDTGAPELKPVIGTNRVDIGCAYNNSTQTATIVCCIDNLVKGAAGAAVQNMNLMFGLPETFGLRGGR